MGADFALPEWAIGQEQHWSMFTHGVCTAAVKNTLLFHRLAIVGGKMGGATAAHIAERLEQASRILRIMGQIAQKHTPGNPTARQCLLASDTLAQEQPSIILSLLASQAQRHISEQGAD